MKPGAPAAPACAAASTSRIARLSASLVTGLTPVICRLPHGVICLNWTSPEAVSVVRLVRNSSAHAARCRSRCGLILRNHRMPSMSPIAGREACTYCTVSRRR